MERRTLRPVASCPAFAEPAIELTPDACPPVSLPITINIPTCLDNFSQELLHCGQYVHGN